MKSEKFKFKIGDVINDREMPCIRIITQRTKKCYVIAYPNGGINLFEHEFVENEFYLMFSGGRKTLRFLKLFGYNIEGNETRNHEI